MGIGSVEVDVLVGHSGVGLFSESEADLASVCSSKAPPALASKIVVPTTDFLLNLVTDLPRSFSIVFN